MRKGSAAIRNVILILLAISMSFFTSTMAQDYDLELRVGNAVEFPGETEVTFPIFLNNYHDGVAGISIFLMRDRPDMFDFHTGFDTASTLIGGWEYLNISLFESVALQVTGLADYHDLQTGQNIDPQSSGTPLIYLKGGMKDIADSLIDQGTIIMVPSTGPMIPQISDIYGNLIGLTCSTVVDTNLFRCLSWVADSICLYWDQVPAPPYDSMEIYEHQECGIDTSKFHIINGQVTMPLSKCGDVNLNGEADIGDITDVIESLYLGGEPLQVPRVADVTNSPNGEVDISDIVLLIRHLYLDKPDIDCPLPPSD